MHKSLARTTQLAALAILVGLLWAAPAIAAQDVQAGGAGDRARPAPRAGQARQQAGQSEPADVADVQRLFDAYLVRQARNALQLDDEQFGRFLPRLRHLQEVRRRHERERQRIIAALSRLSARRASDEAALHERLRALTDLDTRAAEDLRRAYEDLDGQLDVRRQARFRVFEQNMERRKIQLMLRARRSEPDSPAPVRVP